MRLGKANPVLREVVKDKVIAVFQKHQSFETVKLLLDSCFLVLRAPSTHKTRGGPCKW